jgi:hypothetical protein
VEATAGAPLELGHGHLDGQDGRASGLMVSDRPVSAPTSTRKAPTGCL